MSVKVIKGPHINGVPQRWSDFEKIYNDGTDAIYDRAGLSAAQKAAKYGFTVERNGVHISQVESNNVMNPTNPVVEQMMRAVDPYRYGADPKYKEGIDKMLRAAMKMGYEESPQPDYLRKNTPRPGF